ncbi:MAG TPA: extracellular solute-binding protein [Nostocaceae cyanobacterium]|nr:extracellular solute-binding protein [Nostocaceae cyanobacterium]
MDRRSFLLSTSTLIASQLLMGCNGNNQKQFNVQLLKGSIPDQVVNQFRNSLQTGVGLNFTPIVQIRSLFQQLVTWQQSAKTPDQKAAIPDLVTLGDYWLKAAIEQKLIQPLQPEQIKNWSVLNSKWQELVRRDEQGNPNLQGQIWGVPYRWGNTVIIYNRDKFKTLNWRPRDWSDLWRLEMRSRISLLDHHREVIGLVLKKLGKSYNTENLDQIPNLEQELQTLNKQVKFYDSTNYLEPLLTGDTWLAVGWSNDIISPLNRYSQLGVVVPQSGTAIWADLWVRPVGAGENPLLYQWIDFCWQPNIAKQITLLTKNKSPINTNITTADIPENLQALLLTNQAVFDQSEFILPLSPTANEEYKSLFTKIKTMKT